MTEDFGEIIELLNIYKYKDIMIDKIQSEIESLTISKQSLYDIKGNYYNGMPKGSNISDISDKILKVIDIYDKRIKSLEDEILNINKKYYICNKILNVLEPMEKNIVHLFYIKRLKWKTISNITFYSERHCRRLKNSALKKMKYMYKKDL